MLYRLYLKNRAKFYGLIERSYTRKNFRRMYGQNARWEKLKRCIALERCNVRGCPIAWPPISPDHLRLDLFHMTPYENTILRVSYWNIIVSSHQDCLCCRGDSRNAWCIRKCASVSIRRKMFWGISLSMYISYIPAKKMFVWSLFSNSCNNSLITTIEIYLLASQHLSSDHIF